MPIARIVTRFPQRAAALRKTLLDSGYRVEVLRPEEALHGEADLQYDLDDMPEYVGQSDAPAEREFIFAPQWRALLARFGKTEKLADQRAPKTIEPAVSYARLESELDKKFVDQPAQGPSLTDRVKALRTPLSAKLNEARQGFDRKRQQLAQQMAERHAAAEEARRLREIELMKKREADSLAAERARAEAAMRLQQEQEAQQAREAQRLAEVQAQMALRRKQEEEARTAAMQRAQAKAERQRLEAEQRARLEAERIRAAAIMRETAPEPVVAPPAERRRSLGEILSSALRDLGDWRDNYASTHFPDTRSYAFRQYAPAALGVALAFFLGWAIAVGGARKTVASDNAVKAEPTTSAAVPAAVVAAPATVSKPSAVPQHATATKPKAQVRRFRRPSQDDEVVWKNGDHGGDDDVTVIHHYPGKSNLARSGKKNGVKTISDLEQN